MLDTGVETGIGRQDGQKPRIPLEEVAASRIIRAETAIIPLALDDFAIVDNRFIFGYRQSRHTGGGSGGGRVTVLISDRSKGLLVGNEEDGFLEYRAHKNLAGIFERHFLRPNPKHSILYLEDYKMAIEHETDSEEHPLALRVESPRKISHVIIPGQVSLTDMEHSLTLLSREFNESKI